MMQYPVTRRRSFLQPYDPAQHYTNSNTEHHLVVVLVIGFVAALAVRLAGKSQRMRRMLRKHAGGTWALVVVERCLDYLSELGQNRSPRRQSKPG